MVNKGMPRLAHGIPRNSVRIPPTLLNVSRRFEQRERDAAIPGGYDLTTASTTPDDTVADRGDGVMFLGDDRE
jgi:hypothetical protein